MKIAGLLIVALLPAVVLLSTAAAAVAATVKEPGRAPIPANQGRKLAVGDIPKNRELWTGEEYRHGMMRAGPTSGVFAAEDGAGSTVPPEEGKFAGKNYKICLTPGPCYKKKLVCPKQCSGGGGRLQTNHIPGWTCILDCKKCTARC